MHIAPNSKRYSNDLDYFQDSEERVASAFAAGRALLEAKGFLIELGLQHPGFIRAVVKRGVDATKVEWVHDTAWSTGFEPLTYGSGGRRLMRRIFRETAVSEAVCRVSSRIRTAGGVRRNDDVIAPCYLGTNEHGR